MAPFLEINNVYKSFGGVEVLKGVSLSIQKGEIHCLAGENGCGKSTLIKIISGYYQKDSGELKIEGTPVSTITPRIAMSKGIQVVYQDFSLYPSMTIAENIVLADSLQKKKFLVNWKWVNSEASKALGRIKVDIDVSASVETLSIAKKQLVAIAKALYQEAKLVILDEPTTSLTEKEIDILFTVLKGLSEKGVSILLVSHKLREVLRISSRLSIMRNGVMIVSDDTENFTESSISRYMTGREVERQISSGTEADTSHPFLRVEHISRQGSFDDVSMSFCPGEIVGITGLLGSGRSEVVKSIVGLDSIDSGSVIVDGKECRFHSIDEAIKSGIGYVTDDRMSEGLFPDRSVKLNMISASLGYMVRNLFGQLDFGQISQKVDETAKQFNVVMKDPEMKIKYLSGGNAQKVMLGRWLLSNVRLLFLNGPTVGVDIGAKFDIYEKLKELNKAGMIIVIISDDVPELVLNCDRILIFHNGSIVKEMGRAEITEDAVNSSLASLM